MTPHPNVTDPQRNSDASTSPLERKHTSSPFSTGSNRFSTASTETAESSSTASQRNGFATTMDSRPKESEDSVEKRQGKHRRSHKSRSGGGFLLTSNVPELHEVEHTQRQRQDQKGKGAVRASEKKHRRRSDKTSAVGGSPLAANVTTAVHEDEVELFDGDGARESTDIPLMPAPAQLDVDSAQIVNLALNLSESRKMAARRNISSPIPPVGLGFAESTVGGSLKYHLQQQRRVSRNISPKPDRSDRAVTASPRVVSGARLNTSLQGSFDAPPEGGYRYNFSASTLARAEKAKKEIELMAQYRRLLQHIPPLKPQLPDRPQTAITNGTSPTSAQFPANTSSSISTKEQSTQSLGREYNPLQYIRNRRLRLRERCGINSEAEGFGDTEKVISWVDEVAKQSSSDHFQALDYLSLPKFCDTEEASKPSHTSPKSAVDKTRPARPRIDWLIKPGDLLADVLWLEQDDNKRRIEDRRGRKVFPSNIALKRGTWSGDDELELRKSLSPEQIIQKRSSGPELRLDTKLPYFRSVKPGPEGIYDKADRAVTKARHKLRDAAHIHHGQNGSARMHRPFLRSRSKSDSYDSESDSDRPKRSATAKSHDPARTLLEKQMSDLLAQEYAERGWADSQSDLRRRTTSPDGYDDSPRRSYEDALSAQPKASSESKRRQRALGSPMRKSSEHRGNSNELSRKQRLLGSPVRKSSDHRPPSMEGLDSTAPNSPEGKESRAYIPSIAMDLSSRRRPERSTSRRPLARVKTNLLSSRDPSKERDSPSAAIEDESIAAIDWTNPKERTPERSGTRSRSNSPKKSLTHRETNSSYTSTKSLRRKGNEPASGIRGLFKGSRGPITRVSDLFGRKDASPVTGTRSGFSTDDSDYEDGGPQRRKSRDQSGSRKPASPELPSYLGEMPTFVESRGRKPSRPGERPRGKNIDDKNNRHALDAPPTFTFSDASPIHSPGTQSPPPRQRDSSVSDVESLRGARSKRVQCADARLNAILRLSGYVGTGPHALPVTGLAHLEATQHQRPSHPRQWSITDRSTSPQRGLTTKRQIARVRALLLSSGIKAKEITRRAAEPRDGKDPTYASIAALVPAHISEVPRSQEHIRAAQILCDDIDRSTTSWRSQADVFYNSTIQSLLDRVDVLQKRVADELTPMTTKAIDDADEVNRELVANHTLEVQRLMGGIESMLRRRRKRFRWARRGGWVLIEWMLVGIMWYLWFVVMVGNAVMGFGRGLWRGGRWLLWL